MRLMSLNEPEWVWMSLNEPKLDWQSELVWMSLSESQSMSEENSAKWKNFEILLSTAMSKVWKLFRLLFSQFIQTQSLSQENSQKTPRIVLSHYSLYLCLLFISDDSFSSSILWTITLSQSTYPARYPFL